MGSRKNYMVTSPVTSAEGPATTGDDDIESPGAGQGGVVLQDGKIASLSVAKYFHHAAAWQWWVAAILTLPALPILGIAMLLVKLTSRGPALYYQTRVGRHGRHFEVWKVRTMRIDAEAATGAVWTTSLKDPRITWVGAILRLTHIDELPQLWNVLRGDMALVGPRPERPEFTGILAESIPGYLDRLAVLPGVTGLAQVNLPADTGMESVRKKLDLDLRYVEEGNLSLDLRIILCTAARLVCIRSKRFRQLLGVAREPVQYGDLTTGRTSAGDEGGREVGQPMTCSVPAAKLERTLKSPCPENSSWNETCVGDVQHSVSMARQFPR